MKRDITNATEGRYIGGGRDTSALTDDQVVVLKAIIWTNATVLHPLILFSRVPS